MVNCIRFTDIDICDVNENNRYDPKIDQVTDSEGHDLAPAQKFWRLREILKQIGVPGWKGILLSQASQYLQKLQEAEEYSHLGEVDSARKSLQEAREAAQKLPIPSVENRLKSVLKRTLIQGIESNFDRAQLASHTGRDIDEVKTSLETAVSYIQEFNQIFPKKIPLDLNQNRRILQEAYQKGIPKMFSEIEKFALHGHATVAQLYWQLFAAHLADAKKLFGLTFAYHPDQFVALMQRGYPIQVAQEWVKAKQLASAGQTIRTRSKLKFIEKTIAEGNQKYACGLPFDPAKAEEILAEALVKGVEDNFRLALRLAKQGKVLQAEEWLHKAQDYVDEYNQNFSRKPGKVKIYFEQYRANEIRQCARGRAPCP